MKKHVKRMFNSNLNIFTHDIFFKQCIKKDLIILLYHDVSDNPSEFHSIYNLTVSIENFKTQLNFLKKYYNLISPLDLIKGNFHRPAAMITFDDGIKSNFQIAIEILLKEKIPSTHFINYSPIIGNCFYIGLVHYLYERKILNDYHYLTVPQKLVQKYFYDKNLLKKVKQFHGEFANENDLRKFENSNLVFYANHLYNHYNVTNITRKFFRLNYKKNEEYLKKYNNYVNFFSYPFGHKNVNYNNQTDKFLIEKLKPIKFFYADSLSFNKHKTQSYHRFSPDNNMNEKLFKSQIIYNKVRNFLLRY